MITPDLKKYRIGHESESSTKNSTSHCLNGKSLSNNIMDSQIKPAILAYLAFKQKLLRAMGELDPLQILEAGIFQQYQSSLTPLVMNEITPPKPKKLQFKLQPQESGFQTVLRTYSVSDDMKVTQLERRSLSCDKITVQQRADRRAEELRHVQFMMFSNYLKQLPTNEKAFHNVDRNEVKSKQQQDKKIQMQKQISKLKQQISVQSIQNVNLRAKISQIQTRLDQQKSIIHTTQNQKSDRQLEYLLKEKQVMKKLHDAKAQIERLRLSLQNSQEKLAKALMSVNFTVQHQIKQEGNHIQSLRQKVINSGKERTLLAKISGLNLHMRCGISNSADNQEMNE